MNDIAGHPRRLPRVIFVSALLLALVAFVAVPPIVAYVKVGELSKASPDRVEELRAEWVRTPSPPLSQALASMVRDRNAPYVARYEALQTLSLTHADHATRVISALIADPDVDDQLTLAAMEALTERGIDARPLLNERTVRQQAQNVNRPRPVPSGPPD